MDRLLHDRPFATAAGRAWAGLAVALAVLSLVSVVWVGLAISRGAGLVHESGVITGLAMDARAGLFYPPLVGPHGYGGTRYGPGQILAQAGLIRAGLPPIAAGHLLTLAAAAGLWAGMVQLLRLAAVPWPAAAAVPFLLFVSPGTREALSNVRPDLLPTALSVGGLACAATAVHANSGSGPRSPAATTALWAAAVALFAASLIVKITDGFALVAAALLLVGARRPGRGVLLLAVSLAAAALGLLACNAASHGRLWENFHACADPGGLPRIGPARWLALLREVFVADDWPATLMLLLALSMALAVSLAVWAAGPRSLKLGPAGTYLGVTLALTLPLFFSPGMSYNHLIDLHVAVALVIGTCLAAPKATAAAPPVPWPWTAATAVVVLLGTAQLCQKVHLARALFRRVDAFHRLVAAAGPDAARGPILSDNAMVPVALGQRPFLLDDFMFPAVRAARPDAQDDLYRQLQARAFPAVVLRFDPDTPARRRVLGDRFPAVLHANYDLVSHTRMWDELWVYRPKPS